METNSTPHETEIEVIQLPLGPTQTNAYIVGNRTTGEAVMIDPSYNGVALLREIEKRNWRLTHILITHAHFDHFGGCAFLAEKTGAPVALHRGDYPLYQQKGGAEMFGFSFDDGPEPTMWLEPGTTVSAAGLTFEVLHLPGHTSGHVGFYERERGWLFVGDVVFHGSIGRTDLPGGSYETLMNSIREHVLTLPDDTVLFPGHGPVTTVGNERMTNPFLSEG